MVELKQITDKNGNNRVAIIIPKGYVISKDFKLDDIPLVTESKDVTENTNRVNGYVLRKDRFYSVLEEINKLFEDGSYSPNVTIARHVQAINRIGFIMLHDNRFGGMLEPTKWSNGNMHWVINKDKNVVLTYNKCMLAFNEREQAELFRNEYPKLIEDYYCY